ncbi:MAG: hypothetical protein AAF098_17700 [Pseudomonadota bacterium]
MSESRYARLGTRIDVERRFLFTYLDSRPTSEVQEIEILFGELDRPTNRRVQGVG